jgi:hypothetical protein
VPRGSIHCTLGPLPAWSRHPGLPPLLSSQYFFPVFPLWCALLNTSCLLLLGDLPGLLGGDRHKHGPVDLCGACPRAAVLFVILTFGATVLGVYVCVCGI